MSIAAHLYSHSSSSSSVSLWQRIGRFNEHSLLYLGLYCIFSEYVSIAFFFSSTVYGFWLYLDIAAGGGCRGNRDPGWELSMKAKLCYAVGLREMYDD